MLWNSSITDDGKRQSLTNWPSPPLPQRQTQSVSRTKQRPAKPRGRNPNASRHPALWNHPRPPPANLQKKTAPTSPSGQGHAAASCRDARVSRN
ncbi:uncharacterized protein LY79DRAFT_562001 [Colletotrichum navitas]|uniref:Uncharacterized protein n=1 Tax=Colletotrichum navitas TaxID=681940 RepID=A0AAD8V346_9PEZI|nr:uncharacterized protein LY79DRAFT_562001 [Colletotrichum navitas]KAK1580343.1 hypothetical protein LY79DRAFT_562001 [Colletotrichum navitas]